MSEIPTRLAAALADRYRIARELGQGGMATVYLAEDLKHHRRVAIKVLRPELAAVLGADRFVQEIATTAALQHPHILPLFDSGQADTFLYYVMPYIEGETLRSKLDREKQLAVGEAVRITREIADALDYAHRHGVIHRDIKPENILLHDGRPMVADFGIALAVSAAGGGRMTETGLSLGTPHYMSPEQATAEKDITARSDIYSLASVLFEMLAGQPPHVGGSAQQIIMKIIAEPVPTVTSLRKSVPANVAAALDQALERLPADRFASAAEFGAALADPGFTTATAAQPWHLAGLGAGRGRLRDPAVLGLALVAVASVSVAVLSLRRPVAAALVVARFQLPLAAEHGVTGAPINTLAFSPDGRTIAYVGRADGGAAYALYERRLDEVGDFRPIPGTQNATFPSFSPDGTRLAYVVLGKVFVATVPFAGGASTAIGPAGLLSAVVWLDRRSVAVNNDSGGIDRLDLEGHLTPLVRRDTASGERNLWVAAAVPGGNTVLGVSSTGTGSLGRAVAVDTRNGSRTTLLSAEVTSIWYADGILLWSLPNGTIQGASFDPRGRRITGAPVTVAEGVMQAIGGGGQLALSAVGSLVYLPDQAPDLVLVDHAGRRDVVGQGRRFHSPRVSPDGRLIAFDFIQQGMRDVWTLDLRQRTFTRLSFENDGHDPVWSPDGRWVYYVHGTGIWRRRGDGGGGPDSVFTGAGQALEVERNGAVITSTTTTGSLVGQFDVGLWSPDSPRTITPLLASTYSEEAATVSPDHRWLAYSSDETGRPEVYVRAFAGGGAKVLVSRGGGSEPQWSADGRTLYYRGQTEGPAVFIAATVTPGPDFTVTARTALFEAAEYEPAEPHRNWDLTPDGRHFVMVYQGSLTRVNVILNWPAELRLQSGAGRTTP